jgi:hypothetical protein
MATDGAAVTLLHVARTFRPRILAERDHIEAGRRLPENLTRELARAGFFRIFLPAAYEGLDLTPMEAMEVYEELARADASVAWCVWNGNVNWTTSHLSKDVAQEIFADPDMILANSTRPSGQAAIVDGGYRVNGRWSLVSGCQLSSWFILMSIVHEDGRPRRTPSAPPNLGSCSVLPRNARSSIPGRPGVCEVLAAMMSWCETSSCRPGTPRSTLTRSCCPARGTGSPSPLELSRASAPWHWASREGRSRHCSISRRTNGMNAAASHCARTEAHKRGCRKRKLSSTRQRCTLGPKSASPARTPWPALPRR